MKYTVKSNEFAKPKKLSFSKLIQNVAILSRNVTKQHFSAGSFILNWHKHKIKTLGGKGTQSSQRCGPEVRLVSEEAQNIWPLCDKGSRKINLHHYEGLLASSHKQRCGSGVDENGHHPKQGCHWGSEFVVLDVGQEGRVGYSSQSLEAPISQLCLT